MTTLPHLPHQERVTPGRRERAHLNPGGLRTKNTHRSEKKKAISGPIVHRYDPDPTRNANKKVINIIQRSSDRKTNHLPKSSTSVECRNLQICKLGNRKMDHAMETCRDKKSKGNAMLHEDWMAKPTALESSPWRWGRSKVISNRKPERDAAEKSIQQPRREDKEIMYDTVEKED